MTTITRKLWMLGVFAGITVLIAACSGGEAPPMSTDSPGAAVDGESTSPTSPASAELDRELQSASFRTRGWQTDFSRRNVPLADIMSGGPPRDGIPSIDRPRFVSIDEADAWLHDREPVQVVEINGDARAYPTQILMWHEIVNDEVGGEPVAVTYCPLCNTAIVFRRVLPEIGPVQLGVSGNLYQSAMVMYDRATETWFWQVSGTGIVGELTGHRLEMLPSTLTSWEEFKLAHRDGIVLSRETGFDRVYGANPYHGYDTGSPFLFRGEHDDRLSVMERVVTVEVGAEAVAFPFSTLQKHSVMHRAIGEEEIVVFYRPGTISPLDTSTMVEGRDVGSTAVFRPFAQGLALTFEVAGAGFRDHESGSTWNLLGEAIDGPLQGERLEPVVHGNHFWFSWASYRPDTVIAAHP